MQTEQNSTNKVALITGAARRIGAEIASLLHQAGMNIILHYQTSKSDADALCARFNQARSHSACALKADLLNLNEIESLITQGAKQWGRLDVLVNNASRFYKTEITETTAANWDDLLDSNLKAPFFLAKAAIPYLKKYQGNIVNITDIHAERPVRDYPVYCISKAGLVMLTKSLAKELGPEIRVNAVAPGAIAWPEGENHLSDELKNKIIQRVALRRHGEPSDIAKAVLYLVQDGGYVTGQILAVDGGRNLVT